MSPLFIILCFALASAAGFYGAYLYGRRTKTFHWSEYIALMAGPLLGCLVLATFYGMAMVYLFIASSVVGFVLEYGTGLMYHKTLNRRLWTYGKYSVGGYTSLLTFPMWGVTGVVFWLLSRSVGL